MEVNNRVDILNKTANMIGPNLLEKDNKIYYSDLKNDYQYEVDNQKNSVLKKDVPNVNSKQFFGTINDGIVSVYNDGYKDIDGTLLYTHRIAYNDNNGGYYEYIAKDFFAVSFKRYKNKLYIYGSDPKSRSYLPNSYENVTIREYSFDSSGISEKILFYSFVSQDYLFVSSVDLSESDKFYIPSYNLDSQTRVKSQSLSIFDCITHKMETKYTNVRKEEVVDFSNVSSQILDGVIYAFSREKKEYVVVDLESLEIKKRIQMNSDAVLSIDFKSPEEIYILDYNDPTENNSGDILTVYEVNTVLGVSRRVPGLEKFKIPWIENMGYFCLLVKKH